MNGGSNPLVDYLPVSVEFGPEFSRLLIEKQQAEEFPYLIDTSAYMPRGKALTVNGVELAANTPTSTIAQAMQFFGGSGKGNIQVIGGAAGFPLDGTPNMDELLDGLETPKGELPDVFRWARSIYRAANQLNANIVTGGTQSGVMALISSMWLADQVLNYRIAEAVKKRASLLQTPPDALYNARGPNLIHFVPKSATLYNGNDTVDYTGYPSPLAPCTAFVAVEGGSGWAASSEELDKTAYVTSFIPAYEYAVASLPCTNNLHSSRLAIVINGGYLSLLEAKRALQARSPASMIILEGTGRFADLLAACVKNNFTIPDDDHPVWTPRLRKDYQTASYAAELEDLLLYLDDRVELHKPGPWVHTYHADNEGLTSKIVSVMTRTSM
jgi:hypothetical protein